MSRSVTPATVPPLFGFLQRFLRVVQAYPAHLALVAGDRTVTYGELDYLSTKVAGRLRALRVSCDSQVGLYLDRSIEWLVAMMAVLKAGGGFVPIDASLPERRLKAIVADAEPSVIVTDQKLHGSLSVNHACPLLQINHCLTYEPMNSVFIDSDIVLEKQYPESIAYVIYTSGSTGRPKGVAVTRANLSAYVDGILSFLDRQEGYDDRQLHFAHISTFSVDLGHTCLFPALASGGCLHLIPDDVTREPRQFSLYMRQHPIDVLKITPSHWSLLQKEEKFAGPRRFLIFGGECLPSALARPLVVDSSGLTVINHYGPTETTVGCLANKVDLEAIGERDTDRIPVGIPIGAARVYVLDERRELLPGGAIGELYIAGPGVARGYLNRPDLTAERFVPNPFDHPGTRMYRSGDLARVRPDGKVDFLGRADSQVKFHGFRVELGEIEAVARECPGVQMAVALIRENSAAGDRLMLYFVPSTPSNGLQTALQQHLESRLPSYMLPSVFIEFVSFPLTPSGKIDRISLLNLNTDTCSASQGAVTSPRDKIEAKLAEICSQLLKVERVDVHEDLFHMGVDSIISIQIAARSAKAGIKISPLQIFRHRTIARCAELIGLSSTTPPPQKATKDVETSLALGEEIVTQIHRSYGGIEDVYPVSPIQHGILFDCLYREESGAYASQYICDFDGQLDVAAFERAWRRLLARHAALRTVFFWEGLDRPVQVVLPVAHASAWRYQSLIGMRDSDLPGALSGLEAAELNDRLDLTSGPLIRAILVRLTPEKHHFICTFHHLIVDGWSEGILAEELSAIYTAECRDQKCKLGPAGSYRDYVECITSRDFAKARDFWRNHLLGFRGLGNLSCVARTGTGHLEKTVVFDELTSEEIRQQAWLLGVTPNTIAHAIWAVMLQHIAQTPDIVTGIVVSGRLPELPAVESTIGPFVNIIPYRTLVELDKSWGTWLVELNGGLVAARAYEYLPLIEIQQISQPFCRRLAVDNILTFQNTPSIDLRLEHSLRPQRERFKGGWTNCAISVDIEASPQWKVTITCDLAKTPESLTTRIADYFLEVEQLLLGRQVSSARVLEVGLRDVDARLSRMKVEANSDLHEEIRFKRQQHRRPTLEVNANDIAR